jgi:hypothetical protein
MTEIIKKHKVEVMEANDAFTEYTAPLPASMDECIKQIGSDFVEAARIATLRFWRVGRIIAELEKRQEKNVLTIIMERTGYQKRTLQYAMSLYEKCNNFDFLLSVCNSGKVEWSDMKVILPIDDEAVRANLMKKLAEGEMDKQELKAKVKEIQKEKQEKKEKELGSSSPKAKKEKEKVTGPKLHPLKYFEGLTGRIQSFMNDHTNGTVELADYYALILDDKRTTDQEYNACRKEIRKLINLCTTVGTALTKFKDDQEQALTDMDNA